MVSGLEFWFGFKVGNELGFWVTCALEGVLRQTAVNGFSLEALGKLKLNTFNDVSSCYAMVSV